MPRTLTLSLISTGMPASGLAPFAAGPAAAAGGWPPALALAWSLAAASAAADSLTVITARRAGFSRSILAR